jgi:gamma-glutamyltranspeptidase/glutathione hydrolase
LISVGTPGGSTIITSVLQTILNVHEFDMAMQEVVQDSVDVDAILSLPYGRLEGGAEYKGEDTALSF